MIEFPRVLTFLQMNHLAAFLVASLFFRASESSYLTIESDSAQRPTSEEFLQNMDLAVSLSQAFREEEVGIKTEHFSSIYDTNTVPFVFPIFDSYDMDLATKLSQRTGISPQRIFSVLIQIIYSLLQFHVTRFSEFNPLEPFVPTPVEHSRAGENLVQHWFFMLLGAIMPGAISNVHDCHESMEVNCIFVKPFKFLTKGDRLFTYSMRKGIYVEEFVQRSITEIPTVSVYSLPAHLLGKKLTPGQAILHDINLEKSYPHCKEILDYLLQHITFAFDLNQPELGVIVKPTKNIPSVGKSGRLLKWLFYTPIGIQIMTPEDVESVIEKGVIPRASCYHPDKVSFSSPEVYERMLALMIARGVSRALLAASDGTIDELVDSLGVWMSRFLPDSSIKLSKSGEDGSMREVCTYKPDSSTMWIYKGSIDGEKIGISLEFGKPTMLNHLQMVVLRQLVHPFPWKCHSLMAANTPVGQIFNAIVTKLREPLKVVKVEKHSTPIIPSLSTENKAVVLKDPRKFALHPNAFQGTREDILRRMSEFMSNGTVPLEKNVPPIGILRSLDKLSRNYARNTASHFESPKMQTKIYQQSRRVSLNILIKGKVLILFNADKLPLAKGDAFSLLESASAKAKRSYYVSRYKEYLVAGEGAEIIYFIPTPDAPMPSPTPFVEFLDSPVFRDHHANKITCK